MRHGPAGAIPLQVQHCDGSIVAAICCVSCDQTCVQLLQY